MDNFEELEQINNFFFYVRKLRNLKKQPLIGIIFQQIFDCSENGSRLTGTQYLPSRGQKIHVQMPKSFQGDIRMWICFIFEQYLNLNINEIYNWK